MPPVHAVDATQVTAEVTPLFNVASQMPQTLRAKKATACYQWHLNRIADTTGDRERLSAAFDLLRGAVSKSQKWLPPDQAHQAVDRFVDAATALAIEILNEAVNAPGRFTLVRGVTSDAVSSR